VETDCAWKDILTLNLRGPLDRLNCGDEGGLARRLSNTKEATFYGRAWQAALRTGNRAPQIANTDQRSQFIVAWFKMAVDEVSVQVSVDGPCRCLDNVFST
jgi:hypothetical protein